MIKKRKFLQIISFARLHFGFLDLNKKNNKFFGGFGLTINKFKTILNIKNYHKLNIKGYETKRASFFVKKFCKKIKIKPNFYINIEKVTPQHIGLGSGTQIALAIGTGISKLKSLNLNTIEIAKIMGRGNRSLIGTKSFINGGFIIDNKNTKEEDSFSKIKFPKEWKILLIQNESKGLFGLKEKESFKKLFKSKKKNKSINNKIITNIYNSLTKKDFNTLSKSITKVQNYMGNFFYSEQGGKYSNKIISKIITSLKKEKILGYGQTSWGPTGFAFFDSYKKAKKIKFKLEKKFNDYNDIKFIICSGKNNGANFKIK